VAIMNVYNSVFQETTPHHHSRYEYIFSSMATILLSLLHCYTVFLCETKTLEVVIMYYYYYNLRTQSQVLKIREYARKLLLCFMDGNKMFPSVFVYNYYVLQLVLK